MTKLFFTIGLVISSFFLFAQKKVSNTILQKDSLPNIKLAYLGSIKYPGFEAGVELPMIKKQKAITKKNGVVKIKIRERFLVFNVKMYHHKTFHTNWMLGTEWLKRTTRKSGWFTEWAPGLAFSRTLLAGDATYTADANGNAQQTFGAGNNYVMLAINGGLGYDFSIKKNKPFKVFAKTGLQVYAPFNRFVYPRPAFEIGIITNLNTLLKK